MPVCVSGFVTTTFTSPAACAAVVTAIAVAFTTVTFVAATPPIVTVAPLTKLSPMIVTADPPAADPDAGTIPATVTPVGDPPTVALNMPRPCVAATSVVVRARRAVR